MASLPFSTPQHLLSLGMFIFGMDTLPYQALRHSIEWRHGTSDRHFERPASQFLGPGGETISLSGLLVPEVAGRYSAFETLMEMADTGDDYALMNGEGSLFGHFRILKLDRDHMGIMAGGLPRQVAFTVDLERGPDAPTASGTI